MIEGKFFDEFGLEKRSVEKYIFQKQKNITCNRQMCDQKECFILNLLLSKDMVAKSVFQKQ
jgi:hypothetical protein